jgi:hypothetical protein
MLDETATEMDLDLAEHPVVASTLIDCFLAGITNGRAVLEALYGEVADEPVPSRLLALVRGAACPAAG